MFNGATFPYYKYLDMGVIVVNKEHKSFFKKINPLLQDYMSQKSISLLLEKKSIYEIFGVSYKSK